MGTCCEGERNRIKKVALGQSNSTINKSDITSSNTNENDKSRNNENKNNINECRKNKSSISKNNINDSKINKSSLNQTQPLKNNINKIKINESQINKSNIDKHNIKKSEMTKSHINLSKIEKDNQSFRTINSEKFMESDKDLTNNTLFLLDAGEKVQFPPGEQRYQLVRDNVSDIINKKDKLSESIELLFSLSNVHHPNNLYSFSVSIINNKRTGIVNYLGELKEGTGKNIEFGDSFKVDYYFEREQIVIIEPLVNGKKTGKRKEFILCNLMTSRKGKLNISIEDIGELEISHQKGRKDRELNTEISRFQFFITLDNNIFNISKNLKDMFYVLRNIKDGQKRRPVYKSHEYDFELNKEKQTALISLDSDLLCNNNDMEIFFELYSPSIKINECIGFTYFTLNKLKSNLSQDKFEILEIKSQEYGKLGVLKISYNKKEKIGIEQFVKKGQINLEIAIDYTKSNEPPEKEISLHYKNGKTPNDYEKAINSCGKIIAYYDSDQLFPVYGFGGIPLGKDEVSHCFNINFNENDANIMGLDNIIKCYKDSLDKVKFHGPTYFEPVIKKVISNIKYDLENRSLENHYYILMILTDGIINDMNETVDLIVEGSKLPLSIVIIGVGNADFTNMEILDGDKVPLINTFGEIRKRDIVQFVKFNTFKNEKGVNDGDELAEEVLKEIPRQIEEYYQFCGNFYE